MNFIRFNIIIPIIIHYYLLLFKPMYLILLIEGTKLAYNQNLSIGLSFKVMTIINTYIMILQNISELISNLAMYNINWAKNIIIIVYIPSRINYVSTLLCIL